MKIIEINNSGTSEEIVSIRYAVRAVMIFDGKIFIEKTTSPKIIMLPGGGVEGQESNDECVIRECKEECGLVVRPIKELFAIREYCRDRQYYSTYTLCEVVDKCEKSLTDKEKTLNMTSEWLDLGDALTQLDALMNKYDGVSEELYGCHYREYLAIKELKSILNEML